MPLSAHLNTFAGNPLDRMSERRREPAWLADRLETDGTTVLAFWNGSPLVRDGSSGVSLVRIGPRARRRTRRGGRTAAVPGLGSQGLRRLRPRSGGRRRPGRRRAAGARPLPQPPRPRPCAVCARLWDGGERQGGVRVAPSAPFLLRLRPADTGGRGGMGSGSAPPARWSTSRAQTRLVIMLPVRDGCCLLGRQASWPPGRFSALAGFMEPGESIEEACAREISEESGLKTTTVRYHSSQPWPFPSNLMIGLIAEVGPGEARADQAELEAVPLVGAGGSGQAVDGRRRQSPCRPPWPSARQLIAFWANGETSA